MDVKTGLFYLFAAVLLFAAFRVITARNPVYAALYLVLAFFQASAIWLLLRAEFLAISLVLVYVGAVMVLFLFVVMMLDINVDGLRQGFWKHFPLAAGVGALIDFLPERLHPRPLQEPVGGCGPDGVLQCRRKR